MIQNDGQTLLGAVSRRDVSTVKSFLRSAETKKEDISSAFRTVWKDREMVELFLASKRVSRREVQTFFVCAARDYLEERIQIVFEKAAFCLSGRILDRALEETLSGDKVAQAIEAQRPRICFLEMVFKHDREGMKRTFGDQISMEIWREAYTLAKKEDRPFLAHLLRENFLQAVDENNFDRLKAILERNACEIDGATWHLAYAQAEDKPDIQALLAIHQDGIEWVDAASRGDMELMKKVIQRVNRRAFKKEQFEVREYLSRIVSETRGTKVNPKWYHWVCKAVADPKVTYQWILKEINSHDAQSILQDSAVKALLEAKRAADKRLQAISRAITSGAVLLGCIGPTAWIKAHQVASQNGHDHFLRSLESLPIYRAGRKSPNSPRRSPSPEYSPRLPSPRLPSFPEESEAEVSAEE